MAVVMGMATVPSSKVSQAFILPAGLCNFTVYQLGGAQVYLGTSPNVAATSGMPVPASPIQQETYNSVAGAAYYATTGSSTASSFGYIISTAN